MIAYVTRFNPRIFPRPLFFARAIKDMKIYLLRTLPGHFRDPNSCRVLYEQPGYIRQNDQRVGKLIVVRLTSSDISRIINSCYRQDRTYVLSGLAMEFALAGFISKLEQDVVIIKNVIGALGAKLAGKRVAIDMMDLWHCERRDVIFNPLDYTALRKVDCVIVWSKAIAALLKRAGLKCIEYLPFGIDLEVFDPKRADIKLIYEKYPQLEGRVIIGYSGGGHTYHGVHKVLAAYRIIEKRNKDVFLAVQTWGQNPLISRMIMHLGIRRAVIVQPSVFNDPLRLSLLKASSILVLPTSKSPGVYLAERTTMFQFMSTGNAIVAEYSPGSAGVLRNGHNALVANYGDIHDLAEKIMFLIKNDKVAEEIGRNARRDIEEKYNWIILAKKAKNVINALLNKR